MPSRQRDEGDREEDRNGEEIPQVLLTVAGWVRGIARIVKLALPPLIALVLAGGLVYRVVGEGKFPPTEELNLLLHVIFD